MLKPMCISQLRSQRRRVLAVAAGGVFYAALLILGSQPEAATALRLTLFNDKLLHALAYGGLAGFLFLGLAAPPLRRSLWVVAIVAVLGAVDELIQAALPHREADVRDWLVDLAGAASACVLLSALRALVYRPSSAAAAAGIS